MHNLSLELCTAANDVADVRAASLMRQAAERLDAICAQLAEFLDMHGSDDAASAEITDVIARLGAPPDQNRLSPEQLPCLNGRRRYHLVADFSFHFTEVLAAWCQREIELIQFTAPDRATHHLVVADDDELIEIGLKRILDEQPVAILRSGQLMDFPTVRAARDAIATAGAPCPS